MVIFYKDLVRKLIQPWLYFTVFFCREFVVFSNEQLYFSFWNPNFRSSNNNKQFQSFTPKNLPPFGVKPQSFDLNTSLFWMIIFLTLKKPNFVWQIFLILNVLVHSDEPHFLLWNINFFKRKKSLFAWCSFYLIENPNSVSPLF